VEETSVSPSWPIRNIGVCTDFVEDAEGGFMAGIEEEFAAGAVVESTAVRMDGSMCTELPKWMDPSICAELSRGNLPRPGGRSTDASN
jgi:hypothetical protein